MRKPLAGCRCGWDSLGSGEQEDFLSRPHGLNAEAPPPLLVAQVIAKSGNMPNIIIAVRRTPRL
jgi:hypothetical protein